MSARNQVLAITELLEAVLLQLPMENLFLAQEVCKHWRLLITTSDPIQKALFMKPSINAADAAIDAIRCTHTRSDGMKIQVAINSNLCQQKTYPPSPCPRTFTFHEAAIYSRNRDWLHSDTMYVTSPPIPLIISISYDRDAKDGLYTSVGSDRADDFNVVREKFWIWAQCDCFSPSDQSRRLS
ncbi:hypothetical protein KC330_g8273 [Hortaea werneckii]|nr:hypothetical protein KC330_g8273 [Hortaea werneckii]